ncbi:MAG: zf-HC2 domain-containing protein [bacterium]
MSERKQCLDPRQGELLAAYEMGLLTDREQAEFESHLHECADCLEQVYEMAPGVAAMRQAPGELAARMRVASAALNPALDTSSAVGGLFARLRDFWESLARRQVLIPVGVAALLVLLVLTQLRPDDPGGFRKLARIEPVSYVVLDTRSGTVNEAVLRFDEGMARYAAGDYEAAVALLATAVSLGEAMDTWAEEDQAHFYLGLSLLLVGRVEPAREQLQQASHSPLLPVAERSRWYLAQANLLLDDPYGALVPLQALADSGLTYRDRAFQQLEELRRVMADRDRAHQEIPGR